MSGRITMAWSSGKDSCMALHQLRVQGAEVHCLLTTVTDEYERVSMHGVREELLKAQAAAVGLPLVTVRIPRDCSNEIYEARFGETLARLKDEGVTAIAFGDIFLADVRRYREENNARVGLTSLFPLWGRSTPELAREFVAGGFRAVTTCIDTARLDERFLGRELAADFFGELPAGVDPCGENGEFHTFAFAGPVFVRPVDIQLGEVVRRGQFSFCDVLPNPAQPDARPQR